MRPIDHQLLNLLDTAGAHLVELWLVTTDGWRCHDRHCDALAYAIEWAEKGPDVTEEARNYAFLCQGLLQEQARIRRECTHDYVQGRIACVLCGYSLYDSVVS